MARLKATDVQYVLNRIPAANWNEAFAESRDMINFFGGLKPYPRGAGINDNGIPIPIYYTQNSTFVSYSEDDANPAAGHASYRTYTQPWKRYHGATGTDGLLEAVKGFLGYGLDTTPEIMFQMTDLMRSAMTTIDGHLALDGSGNSSANVQGLFYHLADTGTWNTADKSSVTHIQSYVDDNSGADRTFTKTLADGVLDTMRTTRRVKIDKIGMGDEAYHAYEKEYSDYRLDTNVRVGDIIVPRHTLDGIAIERLPIDTNRMVFLRSTDWDLYYLPQASYSPDGLRKVEGPWVVEQSATGYDANDYVLRMYLTLVCRNPWAQAGLFDVERAS